MAITVLPVALAQEPLPPQLPPEIEDRAKALDKQFICPVCPGETLDQAQATLAKQMRDIIRQRLLAGESEAQISDYFVSVYGELVLAAPPKSGFGLAAWVVPPVGLLTGALVVLFVLRRQRRLGPVPAPGAAAFPGAERSESALQPYLRMVDEELSSDDGKRSERHGR